MKTLIKIQGELKAPKNQFNSFGKYKYRSCEDILEATKPLCVKEGALLTISDEVAEINGETFVKAIATFIHNDFTHSVTAFARHEKEKKGMDSMQLTGAASSYARKYALNGLFLIDDTKDSDNPTGDDKWESLIKKLKDAKNVADVKEVWDNNPKLQSNKKFKDEVNKAKARYENS